MHIYFLEINSSATMRTANIVGPLRKLNTWQVSGEVLDSKHQPSH